MAKPNARCYQKRPRGFGWVEVIVSMGIIAVIVALLLPAVQRSREAARRTQCRNNLKQLGLALHNYHDNYNRFPPGFVLGTDGIYQGWGWGIFITPYLDCSPNYNQVNFQYGLEYHYTVPQMNPPIMAYHCPSEKLQANARVEHALVVTTNVHNRIVTPGTVDAKNAFSRSSYFGNAGYLQAESGGIENDSSGEPMSVKSPVNAGSLGQIGTAFSADLRYCDQQSFRGVFSQNSSVKIKDITDGTTNVFLLGERQAPKATSVGSIGHGTWLGVPDCTTAAGLAMTLGDTSTTMKPGIEPASQTTGFGGAHIGGTHFLFCDGTVRFVAQTINIGTYRDLSTIDDARDVADF